MSFYTRRRLGDFDIIRIMKYIGINGVGRFGMAIAAMAAALTAGADDFAPETWFHVIGGNASKEGIVADLDALHAAGVGGIQFFHGHADGELWPGVTNPIPCLSDNWVDLVKFTSDECHKRGMTFKMQNCPGWSMSGGPWITPDKAMRELICYAPGAKPDFEPEDDFREIGAVTFPWNPVPDDGGVCGAVFPNPQQVCHKWAYDPQFDFVVYEDEREVYRRTCPQGAWQDSVGMTFKFPARFGVNKYGRVPELRAEVQGSRLGFHVLKKVSYVNDPMLLDDWETKAGWGLRAFTMSTNAAPVRGTASKTLVFGHVNARRRNHPAPPEATGWECDKMDARGFEANWAGYLGKLVQAGVKIDGTLVDSWECGIQNWTWKMEEEFEKRAGYALRPWLPALFGYILKSEVETERFLLDWRNVCSRLIEENYYGTIARLAKASGMKVQYETAFGDVVPGDILRYWKYADEPMCEFWSPHDDAKGFVGSHDFKPVLPCVSAAHVYGKRRVSAESLTSFELTFDENFDDWKKIIDRHFGRGVTHVVFHTYTHNPTVNGKPPSTSFGGAIGSPFLRGQTWWPYLKDFTRYLTFCGRELERGRPAVDILMYLGDDVNHKPPERELLFCNRYKYDYCNQDVLMTRLGVSKGKLTLPDGMSYRVLWIPEGTYLKSETKRKLAELSVWGAKIVFGEFIPYWQSPLKTLAGLDGLHVHWYHRRYGGDKELLFVAWPDGRSRFLYYRKGKFVMAIDPVTGREGSAIETTAEAGKEVSLKTSGETKFSEWATKRVYRWTFTAAEQPASYHLELGDVRNWATVKVNGTEVSRLWCAPYACDISEAVKAGENELVVEVVSTWYNTLVHDAFLPEPQRTTWTKCVPKSDAPYHPAGLLGSVRLIVCDFLK